jgi:hypothetical protein
MQMSLVSAGRGRISVGSNNKNNDINNNTGAYLMVMDVRGGPPMVCCIAIYRDLPPSNMMDE